MISRIKNVFQKKQSPKKEVDTIPIPSKPISQKISTSQEVLPKLPVEPPQFIVVCGHSTGKQRDHNEDSLFTLTTNLVSDNRHIPFGLYIVADGMGGHQNGEVASALAVRTMASYITKKVYLPLFSVPGRNPEEPIREIMQNSILEAHQAILQLNLGGGTTLTAALVLGDQMTIAHVGDSRAYTINADGSMETLTRDHSLVKRLEELGQITGEEAAVHPQRNVLYRALGQGEPFEPDIITTPLPKPGYLFLCSDGLWGTVNQEDILDTIISTPAPHEACQKLVDAANEAGGPDNITAILIVTTE